MIPTGVTDTFLTSTLQQKVAKISGPKVSVKERFHCIKILFHNAAANTVEFSSNTKQLLTHVLACMCNLVCKNQPCVHK